MKKENKKVPKPKKVKKPTLKEQNEEYLAGWKRAQADYKNLQNSTDEWKKDFVKYSNEEMIQGLLPILDNFKSAFSQVPENEKDSAWVVGFSYIKKQLEEFLGNNGLKSIETEGQEFDLEKHEAVEYKNDTDKKEGTVIKERRAGYELNGKIIQVAKVEVAGEQDKE